jgi:hypothetical protein
MENMRPLTTALIGLIASGSHLEAQNTIGLLTNEAAFSQDGYSLFYPQAQKVVYLVDNCGRLVHTWEDGIFLPGNAVYLMENGDLIRCGRLEGNGNPVIVAGGAGNMVDRRTWDGELIWRFTYNTPTVRMHHDVAPLPNGNVLIIAWEYKTLEEAAALGMDTGSVDVASVWPDHIIEIEPLGIEQANIVWEWHAWDHLIQDVDPQLPNYGVIADHPERLDINYWPTVDEDWHHTNSIDYNEELDQILLSVPFFNEIWVIDHSTTTEEAASSSGGNSGRGGDLLYRWGDPRSYGRGTAEDQTLFFQHDARWLGPGLSPDDEDRGKIMVFNNRVGGTYSSVDVIVPPVDGTGNYTLAEGEPYGPTSHDWRYTATDPETLFSAGLSSAQRMPNGNIFICSGQQGRLIEVERDGTVVWEYVIPLQGGMPATQGTVMNGAAAFHSKKYPTDHPFLTTIEPPSDSYIELEPNSGFCGSLNVSVPEGPSLLVSMIYPNPTIGLVSIRCRPGDRITVMDMFGRTIMTHQAQGDMERLDLSALASGAYGVHVGAAHSTVVIARE